MRVLLDANVLYPTVMREVLLGCAAKGLYRPLWSDRILKEWELAAARLGPADGQVARGEIALVRDRFPDAAVDYPASLEDRLWLPDLADRHVLAAAIAGHADEIVTMNRRDFPRGLLREEGVERSDPDSFLCRLLGADAIAVRAVAADVLSEAQRLSGGDWTLRSLMKKARLPRLGKALESGQSV